MDDLSFLQSLDTEAIEELYQKYRKDPGSVDSSWHHFFQGFDLARRDYSHPESESLTFDEEFKVLNLINGYRKRGHLFTHSILKITDFQKRALIHSITPEGRLAVKKFPCAKLLIT